MWEKLEAGSNSKALARIAERADQSTRMSSWPDRILHGSDAEGVLRRAPYPVLIAKEPNQTRISPILN
jgi:hypothetical protein